eukprot:3182342-Lingulodinium_polyedra.AAC.1
MCEALRRQTVDLTASLCSVFQTLRNGAVESAIRRRSGSQIARLRGPRARARLKTGARVERASVRFASRSGGETSI